MAEIPTLTRAARDGSVGLDETRPGSQRYTWRFRTDISGLSFQPCHFRDDWLQRTGAVQRQAGAGRGVTRFIELDGHALVLRRYRRGGLPRHLSRARFVWSGLEHSRPMREFDILCRLEHHALPAPRVFAVELVRVAGGLAYEASLLSFALPGVTLAERLAAGPLAESAFAAVGACIAHFHAAGVAHADLNAHNILLDDEQVSLIDFDRARWHPRPMHGGAADSDDRRSARAPRYSQANLERLHRSLQKLGARSDAPTRWVQHWDALLAAHADALQSGSTPPR